MHIAPNHSAEDSHEELVRKLRKKTLAEARVEMARIYAEATQLRFDGDYVKWQNWCYSKLFERTGWTRQEYQTIGRDYGIR